LERTFKSASLKHVALRSGIQAALIRPVATSVTATLLLAVTLPRSLLGGRLAPLSDEGLDYAKPLVEAGNGVTLTNYEGMMHGFFVAGGMLDAARRAVAQSAALGEAFAAV
jgi:acetyl esterase